jgi:predicted transcriptional regulator
MKMVLSVKIDPRMKQALERLAEKQFAPVATLIKQALDEYLQKHGLDWRVEEKKLIKAKKK